MSDVPRNPASFNDVSVWIAAGVTAAAARKDSGRARDYEKLRDEWLIYTKNLKVLDIAEDMMPAYDAGLRAAEKVLQIYNTQGRRGAVPLNDELATAIRAELGR